MRLNRSTGGGADRKGRVLVVETQTTTEDLLEGGTLAAEAGKARSLFLRRSTSLRPPGTVWSTALLNALSI